MCSFARHKRSAYLPDLCPVFPNMSACSSNVHPFLMNSFVYITQKTTGYVKEREAEASLYNCTYKPGSVPIFMGRDHLSLLCVTAKLGAYAPAAIGTSAENRGTCVPPKGVASDRVYMASRVTTGSVSSYLAFPSLPLARRFISVALSLRSPSADVIRYPLLRSPDFPHGTTFRHRIARPRRTVAL